MASRAPLPIDPLLPEVSAALAQGNLVLVAEPGAGKTTRVPPALLELAGDRRIAVLEPRRIAARAAARRVADEVGRELGGMVGYEVRFERQIGAATRIVYLTEGLLARRLVADPALREVAVVLLDEFHERHLQSDLALALLRRAQQGPRPDLRIAVMSATIDPAPVAAFLGDCPIIAAAGRVHPVDLEHAAQPPRDPLEREVARALGRLLQSGLDGHVLVFLPGAGEIRRAMDACADLAARHDLLLLPLHGALPSAEQDRALASSARRRKVVFATNVAETSLTIDGVAAVIDSGLARIARHDPWSGLGALRVEPVSRASCIQRAGRAGRTRAGRCVRLYTRHDFDSRREHEVPEIQRADLAEAVLALRAAGIRRGEPFEWFDLPPGPALAAADQLLVRLGAVDRETGALTRLGRQLEEMPVHPRQARVLVDAEARGAGADGALVAALLGERDVRLARRGRGGAAHTSASDVLDDLDALGDGDDRDLDRNAARAVRRAAEQLARFTSRKNHASDQAEIDRALSIALLTGFPDRVARRRRPGAPDLLLSDGAGGGAAVLHPQSAVQTADLCSPSTRKNLAAARTARSPSAPPRPSIPPGCSSSTPTTSPTPTRCASTPASSAWSASAASATTAWSSRRPASTAASIRPPLARSSPPPPAPLASPPSSTRTPSPACAPAPTSSPARCPIPASRPSPTPSSTRSSPPPTAPASPSCAPPTSSISSARTSAAISIAWRPTPSRCPAAAGSRSTTSLTARPGSSRGYRISSASPPAPRSPAAPSRSSSTSSPPTSARSR